ncbi:MAG: hypothetical protein JO022_12650 [Acidobacteriaceae bacterium]|nr:hypothetical protein [Acidobacteriaceae bacterium]
MIKSRRDFILFTPAIMAITALPSLAAETADNSVDASVYAKERFTSLVNSVFGIAEPGVQAWLTLIAVEDEAPPAAPALRMTVPMPRVKSQRVRTESFRLRFHVNGTTLAERTYTLEHPALGSFALFLSPANDTEYSAVINRIAGTLPYPPPSRIRPSAHTTA